MNTSIKLRKKKKIVSLHDNYIIFVLVLDLKLFVDFILTYVDVKHKKKKTTEDFSAAGIPFRISDIIIYFMFPRDTKRLERGIDKEKVIEIIIHY